MQNGRQVERKEPIEAATMIKAAFFLWCALLATALPEAATGYVQTEAVLLKEDPGTRLELWQTAIGQLWIPRPGKDVIKHLEWEQTVVNVYHHPDAHVRPGDVVIDCGAHIGGFTRVALRAGARMVVAIEPQSANLLAFEKNLAQELKTGKVKLIRKGVWDTSGRISLHLSRVGDSHSMVIPHNDKGDETVEVTTLDALVESLKLPQIDFVKMDIEGAEQRALRGGRQLLKRWRPRLAISSYHLKGDPAAITGIVWEAFSGYRVASKDLFKAPGRDAVPKVLFFY
jgi:FkbM family methyltransferase